MSPLSIFNAIVAGLNIGVYADGHKPINLGIGVICGLLALMQTIADNKSA